MRVRAPLLYHYVQYSFERHYKEFFFQIAHTIKKIQLVLILYVLI